MRLDGLDRRAALPVVALTCPPLFLLYRAVGTCGTPLGCTADTLLGYALVALAAVPVALIVAHQASAGRAPGWLAPRPDDATLVGFAGIVLAVDAYLLLSMLAAVPPPADALARPAGVALGLPLIVSQLLVVTVGDAVGQPPTGVQLVAVGVGVALSVAWWFVLAAGGARLAATVDARLGRGDGPRD